MGLRMKNGVVRGGGSQKKQDRGGNCLKRGGGGAKPVCRFNGGGMGLVKNRREGFFFEGIG